MYSSFFYALSPPVKTKQQGFTLTELILVIVLLSILSAIALPRFFSRSTFDERVFFDDTLSALHYAQKHAVAMGCNVRFSINNNRYTLFRDDSCNSGNFSSSLGVFHPATGELGYTGAQGNINLTATHGNTTFDSLGRADSNNIVTVGTRQISIIATTGFSYDSTP